MIKNWITLGAPLLVVGLMVIGLVRLQAPEPASVNELAEVGIGYYKAEKIPEARTVLQQVIVKDPRHFRAQYGLGLIEFQDGNIGLAERHLKQALQVKPGDVEAYLTLGAVYQRGKAYDQAEAIYRDILKKEPNHPKTIYNMGRLLVLRGKLPEARDYLLKYLQLSASPAERIRTVKLLQNIENRMKVKNSLKEKSKK